MHLGNNWWFINCFPHGVTTLTSLSSAGTEWLREQLALLPQSLLLAAGLEILLHSLLQHAGKTQSFTSLFCLSLRDRLPLRLTFELINRASSHSFCWGLHSALLHSSISLHLSFLSVSLHQCFVLSTFLLSFFFSPHWSQLALPWAWLYQRNGSFFSFPLSQSACSHWLAWLLGFRPIL